MLLTGAVWELLRFAILFSLFFVELQSTELSLVRLIWFAGPGLALVAAYVMAAFRESADATLLRVIAVGKLMGVVPAVVLVALNIPELRVIFTEVASTAIVFQLIAPLFVLLIDFLFFLFLVTSASDDMSESKQSIPDTQAGNSSLPDFDETRVEEK